MNVVCRISQLEVIRPDVSSRVCLLKRRTAEVAAFVHNLLTFSLFDKVVVQAGRLTLASSDLGVSSSLKRIY